jgi:ATP-dependent protease ClpP protease subunit
LHIYDEIGFFGVSANDMIRDLADVQGPLDVHINSPGGEVDDGIAIYNALMARDNVSVTIDSLAASIASVIAMAGKEVRIAPQAKMMIHDGFAMGIGTATDFRELADHLEKTSDMIAGIYAQHAGKTQAYWRELMRSETWYYGQEAIDIGLADKLTDYSGGRVAIPPSDNWDMGVFASGGTLPRGPATRNANSDNDADDGTDGSHGPMTTDGHTHNHPAHDGPGANSDGNHSHKHAHHNDNNHDHSHAGVSARADEGGVVVMHADGHMEIWFWDAAAALAKCHSASDFRSICAGEHTSGEPDSSSHWALPHHNGPGSGPDKGGVVAALGRWNQTQDLKNKDAALSHLKAHARALGLPSGDDDSGKSSDHSENEFWSELSDDQILNALKGA